MIRFKFDKFVIFLQKMREKNVSVEGGRKIININTKLTHRFVWFARDKLSTCVFRSFICFDVNHRLPNINILKKKCVKLLQYIYHFFIVVVNKSTHFLSNYKNTYQQRIVKKVLFISFTNEFKFFRIQTTTE